MKDLGLWYQEAIINGVEMPRRRYGDTNENRWNLLIKPFMEDGKNRRFIELGSNAGFYLRKARNLGFEAIGVENDPIFIAQAHYWEECDPVGARTIEEDINKFEIPISHTVLLANIHYWLTSKQIRLLVKKLKKHALRVIVIGRHKPLRSHRSPCGKKALLEYFAEFEAVEGNENKKHFSMMFLNSQLKELRLDEIKMHHYDVPEIKEAKITSFNRLLKTIDKGVPFNYLGRSYYKFLIRIGVRRGKRRRLIDRYIKLFNSIKTEGFKNPLLVKKINGEYVIRDGDHRYLIAKYLRIERIICNTVYYPFIRSGRRKIYGT